MLTSFALKAEIETYYHKVPLNTMCDKHNRNMRPHHTAHRAVVTRAQLATIEIQPCYPGIIHFSTPHTDLIKSYASYNKNISKT